jgi:hypothetical protein
MSDGAQSGEAIRSSERLAKALEDSRYLDLAARARRHEFHDFLSPHAMNFLVLVADLKKKGKRSQLLIDRVVASEFDAPKQESDEWAASPEGKATLDDLGPLAEKLGLR